MIRASLEGVDVTIGGLGGLGVRAHAAAFEGVIEGLKVAAEASEKMVTATDHTLAMLALMGHPYAAAHPDPPHTDPVIHEQSGAYARALVVKPPIGDNDAVIGGTITIDDSMKQLDEDLQEGTTRMIARPWMEWVMREYGQDIADLIVAKIQQGIAIDRAA